MDEDIRYKDKCGLDAIALWSVDHIEEIGVLRRLFAPVSKSEAGTRCGTFSEELAALEQGVDSPGLLDGLVPSAKWEDARDYMARLVCCVWRTNDRYNSHKKAANYVFRIAREGSSHYSDCRYARTLLAKYGKQESTIVKEAKQLHAKETHFKKRKWSGMERPPTVAQQAKKSERDEMRQMRKEKNNASR